MTKMLVLSNRQRTAEPGRPGEHDLVTHLLRQSDAMARYALAKGHSVPETVIDALSECWDAAGLEAPFDKAPLPDDLADRDTDERLRGARLRKLVWVHDRLAKAVAPATPGSVLFLSEQRVGAGPFRFLGPVPMIRQMTVAAVLSLITFIGLALSPFVTAGAGDIFSSSGLPLLVNELFLVAAASLGASFAALFRANRYVVAGTFDPTYDSSYWTSFALGLIAGVILSELVPLGGDELSGLGRPSLAMLGGFSSQVVYRILRRLIATVDSLVRGETREIIDAQGQIAQTKATAQVAETRMELAGDLMRLRQSLAEGADTKTADQHLAHILEQLLPRDTAPREGVGPRDEAGPPPAQTGDSKK